MRKLIYILLFLPLGLFSQSIYYVAPSGGSNSNPGTIDLPWATWQYAFNTAVAGDTVYFRAGTWTPTTGVLAHKIIEIDPAKGRGHTGTHDAPLVFMAYPADGGRAILDCSAWHSTSQSVTALSINNVAYWEFHGLEIKNLYSRPIPPYEMACFDCMVEGCTGTIIFNNCSAHDGGGVGFRALSYDTIYYNNCDSYNRCDSLDASGPGGDADGFLIASGSAYGEGDHKLAVVDSCRAWNCSDDGYDIGSTKRLQVTNSYSFNNGSLYAESYRGDGTGFKFSASGIKDVTVRLFHNNVTCDNIGGGVADLNLYAPNAPFFTYYNYTSYRDYYGHTSGTSGGTYRWVNDSASIVVANHLVYAPTKTPVSYSDWYTFYGAYSPYDTIMILHTNTWQFIDAAEHWYCQENPAFTVTDADFVNLDTTGLTADRQSDGSFPNNAAFTTFLHLDVTSDLINGGTDMGLPYSGDAPDIGAFEYTEELPPTAPLVSTVAASGISVNQITSGGTITSDGGGTISDKGVCYGSSANPTTADSKVSGGTGVDDFTVTLTGLIANTTYHMRAYAVNETDTGYGADVEFTTSTYSKLKYLYKIMKLYGMVLIYK